MKFDWLDDGNLLLLLPEGLLDSWGGVASGDYDRACRAGDPWLAVLEVGEGTGLVLGGEPGMALVTEDGTGAPVLVRWLAADEEEALVAFALAGRGAAAGEPEPPLVVASPGGPWRLFDAARPGRDAPGRSLVLPRGQLLVASAYVAEGPNAAVVHRFAAAP